MKKLFFIILVVFNVKENLQAQDIKIGIEAGLGIANTVIETSRSGYSPTQPKNLRMAFRGGGTFNKNIFGKYGYIQTGLFYSSKGTNELAGLGKSISFNCIELPLTIEYKFNDNSNVGFWIGAGGYISYIINPKVNFLDYSLQKVTKKAEVGSTRFEDDIRRLEYGIQFQGGLSFKKRFYIRFLTQKQLNNLAQMKDPDLNSSNPSLSYPYIDIYKIRCKLYTSITLGYFLNFKNKKH